MKITKVQKFADKKTPVSCDELILDEKGIVGDFHYGSDGTQVTVLSEESVAEINEDPDKGLCLKRYKPNIVISGYAVKDHKIGSQIKIGEVVLEVSGYKECFPKDCELSKNHAICPLQKGAGFMKVINGGTVRVGDTVE